MENLTMTTAGSILTITIDLKKTGSRSHSGKTINIASTSGFKPVAGGPTGREIINISCNLKD